MSDLKIVKIYTANRGFKDCFFTMTKNKPADGFKEILADAMRRLN